MQKLVYLAQRRKAGKVVDKLPSADLTIDPSDDGVPGANGVPGAKGRMCKPVIEARNDLSPDFHPAISRVRSAFEPIGLGGATGWGAEPPDCSSAPARRIQGALSSA